MAWAHDQPRQPHGRAYRCIVSVAAACLGLRVVTFNCFAASSHWIGGSTLSVVVGRGSGRRNLRVRSSATVEFHTEVRGEKGTESFRRFFLNEEGREVSPWHDIPLDTDVEGEKWMVTEIPKMTKPKMEIATKEPVNPIAQDMKKGKLRDYHGPIFWNYGYLPQTWEDPSLNHPELKVFGDNDPLDVVEIGSRTHEQGEISRVKVLGALAMIDDGELDWKIIAIDTQDPMAAEVQTMADVQSKMPGVISGIREWFRWYKTPDGKPLNAFGFNEEPLDRTAALDVVEETHDAWKRLRNGETIANGLWTGST